MEFVSLLEKKAPTRLDSKEEAAYLEVIESYSPNDLVGSSKYLKLEAERDGSQAAIEVDASKFNHNNFTRDPSFKKVRTSALDNGERRSKPWSASKPGGIVDSIKNKVLSCTKQPNCNDTGTVLAIPGFCFN